MSISKILNVVTIAAIAAMSAAPASAQAGSGIVLPGVLDMVRSADTSPYDGCAQIHKAVSTDNSFMLFTCEKLLPGVDIAQQAAAAEYYKTELKNNGWKQRAKQTGDRGEVYATTGPSGCEYAVDMMVWEDRALNEPLNPAATRDDYRQIIFFVKFDGPSCNHRFDEISAMSTRD